MSTVLSLMPQVSEALFLGAHCDDIEIGCGGTLATLVRARPAVKLNLVVFSGETERAAETRAAIQRLTEGGQQVNLQLHSFRDGFFPMDWQQIKERFEELKRHIRPDVIFTHYGQDRHQDHRVVSELTWNTFRHHLVLEYEIPKWDGDLGQPGFYFPLDREMAHRKADILLECFASQAGKRWFDRDLFMGLMRIRGMECNASEGLAEAFFARKIVAGW